jgi:hypothetical protein
MFFRKSWAMLVGLGLVMTMIASAHAGVVKAVKAKHKANPDSLHAKVQANIKDHKAYSGHQPIRPSKRK